jgi:endoglycosylceramidase
LVFWEALEPQQGHIDTAYLQATIAKVKEITACSLDVIIDMHQDLFAQKFSGNGFPEWMVRDQGKPFKDHPDNWALNYLEAPVLSSFTQFWTDEQLQARYITAVRTFLKAVDTIPGVTGFDVFNEPFPGTTINFEKKYLTGFYQNIQTVFAGSSVTMFFEPWMSTSSGLPTSLEFKPIWGGVYAPHYYDAFICESGKPYGSTNKKLMAEAIRIKASEAEKFNSPMLFGEFGISTRSTGFADYLKDFCDLADQYGAGWTYWCYDQVRYSGFGLLSDSLDLLQPQVDAITRIYPQRIAGVSPVFKNAPNLFTLEYTATDISAPTIIFIPENIWNIIIKVNGEVVERQSAGHTFSWSNQTVGSTKIEVAY